MRWLKKTTQPTAKYHVVKKDIFLQFGRQCPRTTTKWMACITWLKGGINLWDQLLQVVESQWFAVQWLPSRDVTRLSQRLASYSSGKMGHIWEGKGALVGMGKNGM